ncbi:deazapurine DNA modification protein DpdA family protein [Halostella pelagica]|uniref:deazapurine DNA modification protein DpdA family protein n=1 Tax=Halostella pelagica TaxID=2583824 RepID=UPI0010822BA5|nr:hypothetical protein [Halostella pelagica]
MSGNRFRFYFGCASGSARKALRKMEVPNVMISYATANNTPFDTIEHLFIDSGGYSQLHTHQEYQTSDQDYLSYIREHDPELFALRDYPCDPGIRTQLDRTVEDRQKRTAQKHRKLLSMYDDSNLDSQAVAVLQGWTPQQYLSHIDMLRSEGVLTRYVAIGSLSNRRPQEAAKIIHKVRDALPSRHRLHGLGVSTSVLRQPRIIQSLDSADSAAYDFRTRMEEDRQSWQRQVYHYLRMKRRVDAMIQKSGNQQSLFQTLQK